MRIKARGRIGGFTLVELLVVMAVVAILLAMSIPALQKARLYAGEKVCASNLRQVGLALVMKADDTNGRYPIEPTEHNPHPDLLEQLLRVDPGVVEAFYCPQANYLQEVAQSTEYIPVGVTDSVIDTRENRAIGNVSYVYWSFQANKYCPDASGSEAKKYWRNPTVFFPRRLTTTRAQALYPGSPLPAAMPSERWVITDFFRRTAPFPHGHKGGSEEGGLNVGFLDGHVDLVRGRPRDGYR